MTARIAAICLIALALLAGVGIGYAAFNGGKEVAQRIERPAEGEALEAAAFFVEADARRALARGNRIADRASVSRSQENEAYRQLGQSQAYTAVLGYLGGD